MGEVLKFGMGCGLVWSKVVDGGGIVLMVMFECVCYLFGGGYVDVGVFVDFVVWYVLL